MIGALVALLSLSTTERLVAAGVVAMTLSVTGATNATPVVVQTATPHGLIRPAHGVVANIGGNADANGTWVLTPTDATHLRLSTFSNQGAYQDSVGSGSYTSGGTIQIAFPDGSILLGRRNVAMQTSVATPRIVFVPMGSPAWDLEPYGGVIPPGMLPRTLAAETPEQRTMKQSRQLATEAFRFEVHVTGCASPPSPDFGDFDVTQALYQTLYGVIHDRITAPRGRVLGGRWASQDEDVQQLDVRGQKWIGIVEIQQPVIDNPLAFIPTGTVGIITVNFAGGSSGDQTIIVTP